MGRGRLIYPNGDIYEGDWAENNAEGMGVYSTNEGTEYVGELSAGKFNGFGELSLTGGQIYKGNF